MEQSQFFYQSSSQHDHNLFTEIQIFLCIAEFLSLFFFSGFLIYTVHLEAQLFCSFFASVSPLDVHFPAQGSNEGQQRWVATCIALYGSAVINRACQMENEMPARPCCSAGCQCLFERETDRATGKTAKKRTWKTKLHSHAHSHYSVELFEFKSHVISLSVGH